MNNSTFQYDFKELNLNTSQIESVLGYNETEDRRFVIDLIDEILNESGKICNIKAQYSIFNDVKFDPENKCIVINNIRLDVRKIVFSQLKKSDSIAVLLCTAGEEIGARSKSAMKERDFLRGYIYDVVGSEIVEAATDLVQAELEKEVIASEKKITNRYSPGYCDWYVADQHKLFQLMPDNFCGITLTESALMSPVKSISAIIGIGENVKFNPYTCGLCDMKDCVYRKTKK